MENKENNNEKIAKFLNKVQKALNSGEDNIGVTNENIIEAWLEEANTNQFKIDISGTDFIFLKDELLNVSEGN